MSRKIIGVTVGTTIPKPNWEQTDPKKGDYIKNKPEVIGQGKDGITPHIGANGNWFIGDTDTGMPSRGEAGPQGEKGETGPQGEKGATGATGPEGPQGPQGDRGDTGAQGVRGETGPKGDTGEKGDTGAQGPQGEKGDAGPQGEQGPKGDKGDKGDTGATGAAGKDGKDGVDGKDGKNPVKGTDYWTPADKAEIINELSAGATAIPSYWQTHLDARVDSIREAMELAGRNKSAFLFYTDAHWDDGSRNTPMLLNYLFKHTPINKTLFGGDIVSDEPTVDTLSDRSIMEYLWNWRIQIRDLNHYSVVGNHDDGNKNTATGGATNSIFTTDYVYSFLFAPEENNRGIVRDADTYYYFDDTREKTRYLCLDTAYLDQFSLSAAQETFIKDALKSTPENYHIIVLSHIWYMPDYDQYDQRPVPLTGLSDVAQAVCNILDLYNARDEASGFKDCKAKVEFCIGGHVHQDVVDKTSGGIPIIVCECAGMGYRGAFSASAGTISETAISGIVADYDNDKLSIIRIGRGNSIEVQLSTGTGENIPDVEPEEPETPDTPTYTNVLDTVGYVEGVRLSGSSGEERDSADNYTTGFIPCAAKNDIYLKNVNMPNTADNYGCFVAHYNADKTFIDGFYYNDAMGDGTQYMEYDENGYCTKFRVAVRNSDVGFIRICCLGIDDTSIITVNEPIE